MFLNKKIAIMCIAISLSELKLHPMIPAEVMPKDLSERLEKIIDKGDVEQLEQLVNDTSLSHYINAVGLQYAIRTRFRNYGHTLPNGQGSWWATYNPYLPDQGITPLLFAVSYAKPEIVRYFLNKGAKPNMGVLCDDNMYYPLMVGFAANFDDSSENDALVEIAREFSKKKLSQDHLKQAHEFIDTVITAYSPELASRLSNALMATPINR